MKKLTAALLCLCVTLCGCNSEPITEIQIAHTVSGEDVIIQTPDTMYLGETVHAIGTCPVTKQAIDDTGHAIFTQTYQKFRFYLDNDQVQTKIETDLQQKMDQFFAEAGTIQTQAQEDCYQTEDWMPYYARIRYTPARVDDAVISLYAIHESYSGTSPAQTISSVTYDAATGAVLYLGDILEENCTGSVLSQLIIGQLSGIGTLYAEYQDIVSEIFSTNLSGYSNWYLDEEGLRIQFAPYEVNPAGISIIMGYDALSGYLKEQYLPGTPESKGSLAASLFGEDDAERFSFMADLELDPNGTAIAIYPNGTVTNLRVESGTLSKDETLYTPDATIFSTDAFYLGNALIITMALDENAPILRIRYASSGQTMSAYLLCDSDDGSVLLAYG